MKKLILPVLALASLSGTAAMAAPLSLDVYNPQDKGIFAVSSTLITGPTEAMLVDSQFSIKDGEKLVEMINASGKKLKTILITSGDPDFYFGLEPVIKAFPDAKVFATPEVVKHINETKDAKLTYWGPLLKDGAPSRLTVPEVTKETRFYVDGEKVEIHSPESYAAYVWVPSAKAVLGGTGVSWGIHVWTADTQTEASRKGWIKTLSEMQALHPERVIPGHYLGNLPGKGEAITFTSDYLKSFDKALKAHKNSEGVISAMEKSWPDLQEKNSLELSAKVNTGEMKW
ncbi:Vmh family MBL fold metallo-hydrolase [Salmonella enterica]|uniref:Vmh family MBL fold metallo-hydrolase n=1 Tax=Salmonella enterica TaxID=28901 RepID=UPI000A017770|nr:Vmh family MBL fold metallo-hydrolase [Salmonella enterica]EKI9308946.1 MBL fold metallo-hydrolase [Escherichia coli]ORG30300.1 MBL fold metallo-hydrolase [Salmonella enterica subsp. enterica serovar Typhimurium]HCN7989340.1 MBL fold metallo-hydrolase [Escherichia coli]HDK6359857.1 MBL fold metallo-hydrolase [Klebsiella variicola]